MNGLSANWIRTALTRVALAASVAGSMVSAHAEQVVGLLADGNLITFDSATPGSASAPIVVTGLRPQENLTGIDLRPSTGVLYGLSANGSLYTLNATTGAATFVGSVGVAANFSANGFDFNPVPDLGGVAPSLRITQFNANLRVNVNAGSIGTTIVDPSLNGAITFLDGVAYSNNDLDPATGTTLYGIYVGNLYQVTVASGLTTLVGSLDVGPFGGNTATTGFDISGSSGASFAALTNPSTGASAFYGVNLGSGAATLVGLFSSGVNVIDITAATVAPVVAAVPEPETYAMMLAGLAAMGWVARRRQR